MAPIAHTLTQREYLDPEVYELERTNIFHRGWFVAGRADRLRPGNRDVVDVAGESVLLTRDRSGTVHAFANVCRHRGARLCEGFSDSTQASFMCPYHAWTYSLDGALLATPRVDEGEIDRADYPLWRHHVHEWEGFLFVSVADAPPPFEQWLATDGAELLALERFGLGRLVVGATSRCSIDANWKIVIENYLECLHCAHVHPEFAELVPHYRTGWSWEREHPRGGVTLSRGNSLALTERHIAPIAEIDADDHGRYYSATVFPNAFVDLTATCAVVSMLHPEGPARTVMTMDFLFAPDAVAAPDFDPTPIVEFNELVAAQDNAVCEMVQRGVASRRFDHGVLTRKDLLVKHFVDRYRTALAD